MAAAAARTLEAQRLSDQASEDLADIDRVRTALLAAVGHDLRDPLPASRPRSPACASPEPF